MKIGDRGLVGHNSAIILSGQQGQASVFVLAMLGVVLLITVFLYQSGRLTSEKMQIQNGADAAAYGASVLEARSLNFAAYTNRAMVANEVAVGQLVGLLSFADELRTTRKYADAYATVLDFIGGALSASVVLAPAGATVIAIGEGVAAFGNTIGTVGDTLQNIFKKILPPAIQVLSVINSAYSTCQKIYQCATYALILENVNKSLKDNIALASGQKGPELSPFGFIALLGHIPSSWSGHTRIYTPKDDGKNKGMQRFAATVRANRDGFSSGDPNDNTNRDWRFGIVRNLGIVTFGYGLNSAGGSELRATGKSPDKSYAWTAADGLVFKADLRVSVKVPLTGKRIKKSWSWNIPFGTGGYQAVGGNDKKLPLEEMLPSWPESIYGPRNPEVYGGAVNKNHWTAFPGVALEMNSNTVAKYKGLQPYRDIVEGYKPTFPFSSPYFLVGVTKPLEDLKKQGPQFAKHYDLYPASDSWQNKVIGAVAKSEVYFARPTLKQPEKPNVFSPYWQARLVETSNSERFFALAIQQDTLWLTEDEADLIGGDSKFFAEARHIVNEIKQAIANVLALMQWI